MATDSEVFPYLFNNTHYTSEANILKVIQGLFLDELRQELAQAGTNRQRLDQLHRRLEKLRFLDPSCGCGNFLVVTYRELRLLEQEILERLFATQVATGQTVDLALYARVQVDQAYGGSRYNWAKNYAKPPRYFPSSEAQYSLMVNWRCTPTAVSRCGQVGREPVDFPPGCERRLRRIKQYRAAPAWSCPAGRGDKKTALWHRRRS